MCVLNTYERLSNFRQQHPLCSLNYSTVVLRFSVPSSVVRNFQAESLRGFFTVHVELAYRSTVPNKHLTAEHAPGLPKLTPGLAH